MTTTTQPTYIRNFALQWIFYFPMMLGYIVGLTVDENWIGMGIMAQFFVGIAQVMSSFYYSIKYGIAHQVKYMLIALAYLAFLFFAWAFRPTFNITCLLFFVIPVCMATWYHFNLLARWYTAQKKENDDEYTKWNDTVLDDLSLL